MIHIDSIRGVGAQTAKKLAYLGIHTPEQLLTSIPRSYTDYSKVSPLCKVRPGKVTICVEVKNIQSRYVRRGLHITEALASDETGSIKVIWFNQPFRALSLKTDEKYFMSGEFGLSRQRMCIVNPATEKFSELPVHTARIVPTYKETKGLNSSQHRRIVNECFHVCPKLEESLPTWILKKYDLMPRHEAYFAMHFPSSTAELEKAQKRIGFEEVFYLSLASLLNKYANKQEKSFEVKFDVSLAKKFVAELPFKLTDDQRAVLWQIFQDMQKPVPMNRLVEGDVGSGKTVVAAMAAAMAMQAGFQVAYMAPTELLARQHAISLRFALEPLGLSGKIGLLIGSLTAAKKTELHQKIKQGEIQFVVGTHALIADKVAMQRLGLVIVDEQHRFGVEQRKKLQGKAHSMPHVLSMTATPIPRSLALTLYGELDISVISTLPSGRRPIETTLVSPNSRSSMYKKLLQQLKLGRQAFVVCPTISSDGGGKLPTAEQVYDRLSKNELSNHKVGLLHGKMKSDEKDRIMKQFLEGKINVLVATTVIEVGVHVPNATVMIIEAANRFGLAQLHQLRGRVGRSEHQAYCFAVLIDSQPASARMRAFASTYDGFELSELDLNLRGPGAIYGTIQSGALDLRVAKLSDTKLIALARDAASTFIEQNENLLQYPLVAEHVQKIRTVTNLN